MTNTIPFVRSDAEFYATYDHLIRPYAYTQAEIIFHNARLIRAQHEYQKRMREQGEPA